MAGTRTTDIILDVLGRGPATTSEIADSIDQSYKVTSAQMYRLAKAGRVRKVEDKWHAMNIAPEDAERSAYDFFVRYLEEKDEARIRALHLGESETIEYFVDWDSLPDGMEDMIRTHWQEFIYALQHVYKKLHMVDKPPFFELSTLPDRTHIRSLGADLDGALVAVEGDITQIYPTTQRYSSVVYECKRCHVKTPLVKVLVGNKPEPPLVCSPEWGGCGKNSNSTAFEKVDKLCTMEDEAYFLLEENNYAEAIKPAVLVRQSQWLIEREPEGRKVRMGNTVKVIGILKTRTKTDRHNNLKFEQYIEASHIEVLASDITSVDLSEKDVEEVIKFSKQEKTLERLQELIAPDIYGMALAKRVTLLAGVYRPLSLTQNHTRKRANVNILLLGHTGTAKSSLLQWWSNIYPKASFISGPGATTAGLYGMAQLGDERLGGRYTIIAGTIPRGHGGIILIDEVEKQISKYGDGQLHEALEHRQITIAKGDIRTVLQADAPVFMASNWKGQLRRDDYAQTVDSIPKEITPTIISRCILINVDKLFTPEDQENIRLKMDASWDGIEDLRETPSAAMREVPFIVKYLCYARQIRPDLGESPEVKAEIRRCIDVWEKRTRHSDGIEITKRLQEDFYRLVLSSAMLHLREVPIMEDVYNVLPIFEHMIKEFTTAEGNIDIGLIGETGIGEGEEEIMTGIEELLKVKQALDLGGIVLEVPGACARILEKMEDHKLIKLYGGEYSLITAKGHTETAKKAHNTGGEEPFLPEKTEDNAEKPQKVKESTPEDVSEADLGKICLQLTNRYKTDIEPNVGFDGDIFTSPALSDAWERLPTDQQEELKQQAIEKAGWTRNNKGKWKSPNGWGSM